jgi:short-subunit dehydrogenase
LIALSAEELDGVLGELHGAGIGIAADIAEPRVVEDALLELAARMGPIDILVNNAGIGSYRLFVDTPAEAFEDLMRVNYFAAVRAIRTVLPGMIARHRGHIVNVASVVGRIGAPFEAAYAATKFALVGLTESLASEVERLGLGVSIVNPAAVATGFFAARGHPYPRTWPGVMPPERVARAVIRAVERGSAEVFVPWWLRHVLLVKTLLPGVYRWGVRTETTAAAPLDRRAAPGAAPAPPPRKLETRSGGGA